jgi:hypothetical protein
MPVGDVLGVLQSSASATCCVPVLKIAARYNSALSAVTKAIPPYILAFAMKIERDEATKPQSCQIEEAHRG